MDYRMPVQAPEPERVFSVNPDDFPAIALEVFQYQYQRNPVYREFCDLMAADADNIRKPEDIPCLPVSMYKTREVSCHPGKAHPLVFESSRTSGQEPSRHYVWNPDWYRQSITGSFRRFIGEPADFAILALLPSYLERENASLVYMARYLMELSGHPDNGFYLHEFDSLAEKLRKLERNGQQALLLGVTFALLDFAASHPVSLQHTLVIETGGMKGRREEMTREEVHTVLKKAFRVEQISSEYGMTELLSQAWSGGNGIFHTPPWMRVMVSDPYDPLSLRKQGQGRLHIIDLANVESCSFLATDDLGKIHADGSFEVLGRTDHSEIRGCNLMVP